MRWNRTVWMDRCSSSAAARTSPVSRIACRTRLSAGDSAAGTGREHEEQRRAVVLDWMWGTVLPSLQGLADERGFGREWRTMTAERTPESALAAREAAREAEWANAAWAAADAARADAAADAAWAAWAAAAWAAWAAADAAAAAWAGFDPCGLLKRLIETGDTEGTNE